MLGLLEPSTELPMDSEEEKSTSIRVRRLGNELPAITEYPESSNGINMFKKGYNKKLITHSSRSFQSFGREKSPLNDEILDSSREVNAEGSHKAFD